MGTAYTHARTLTLAGLILLLTLAGACSNTTDPATPPATPAATTATPATAPAPTVPVMPQAAKAHTKAGAKAFVRHFWDVVDYGTNTGDTAPIRALTIPGCRGCEGGIGAVDKLYRAGGSARGGHPSLARFDVDMLLAGSLRMAHVTATVSFTRQHVTRGPAGGDTTHRRPNDSRQRLELVAEGDSWKVAQLVVLS